MSVGMLLRNFYECGDASNRLYIQEFLLLKNYHFQPWMYVDWMYVDMEMMCKYIILVKVLHISIVHMYM